MSPITFETSRFGTVEVDPDRVIDFPAGLIGLGGHRFTLLDLAEQSAFSWLQSLEDPDLALPVTQPGRFFEDYVVELSDEDTERLGEQAGELDVWVTVRAVSEVEECTANLRAPILVAGRLGYQMLNESDDAPLRAPLFAPVATQAA